MQRTLAAIAVGLVLTLGTVAPAVAADEASPAYEVQQGCAIAVAHTAGTPGAAFVQAACNQASSVVQTAPAAAPVISIPAPPVPVPPVVAHVTAAQGVALGCGIAVAQTAGTPGAAAVQAGCSQALNAVGASPAPTIPPVIPPPPAPISKPVTPTQGVALGCGIAITQTAGTPGAPFVQAGCDRALTAVGTAPVPVNIPVTPLQAVELGCGIAVTQTAGTPGAPFVQTACGQALSAVGTLPDLSIGSNRTVLETACRITFLETEESFLEAYARDTCIQ